MAAVVEFIEWLVKEGVQAVEAYTEVQGTVDVAQDTLKRGIDYLSPENTQLKKKLRHSSNNLEQGAPPPNIPRNTMPFHLNQVNQVKPNEGTGDHEVPVMPLPKRVALSCPDYFSIDLPWCETGFYTATRAANQTTPQAVMGIRLNSIFDPIKIDIRTVASGGAGHQPMGRDLWAAIYQYYRVIATHVEITCWNLSFMDRTTSSDNEPIIAGIEWTDDDTSTGKAQTINAFMEEKQCSWQIIHPRRGTQHLSGGPGIFTYNYSPQNWQYHVQNSADDDRWTAIGADPTLPHYLNFSFFPFTPGSASTKSYSVELLIKLKYTVQFREANYSYVQTEH